MYFRHGAKSEPGTTADLHGFIERRVEQVRDLWLGRVRQVIEAPEDARMVTVQASDEGGVPTEIRLTDDPSALVYGKLDPDTSHPFRQTELIDQINAELPAGVRINTHDMLSIRRAHGITAESQIRSSPTNRCGGLPSTARPSRTGLWTQIKQGPDFVWKARENTPGVDSQRWEAARRLLQTTVVEAERSATLAVPVLLDVLGIARIDDAADGDDRGDLAATVLMAEAALCARAPDVKVSSTRRTRSPSSGVVTAKPSSLATLWPTSTLPRLRSGRNESRRGGTMRIARSRGCSPVR